MKVFTIPQLIAIAIFSTILLLPNTSMAARLFVENNGTDSGSCGSKDNPCRSISQAIQNASGRDRILVGPGRYGDLNSNGTLGEPGEEFGSSTHDALIPVTKPVTIVSSQGAHATLIDAGGSSGYVFRLLASSIVLGRPLKGFAIAGGTQAQVLVEGSNTTVRSNRIFGALNAEGIAVGCETSGSSPIHLNGLISNNSVFGTEHYGIRLCANTNNWRIMLNELSFNKGSGIHVSGDRHRVARNNVLGSGADGIHVAADRTFVQQNLTHGNTRMGLDVNGDGTKIVGNSVIGNLYFGIFSFSADVITKNNIYGNNPAIEMDMHHQNCGIFFDGLTANLNGNFYGSASGPGQDPADNFCSNINLSWPDFRKKQIPFKMHRPRN